MLPASGRARGHRRRRADGQFHVGHRDFRRRLHALLASRPRAPGSTRAAGQRRGRRGLQAWRSWSSPSTAARSKASPKCSASSARALAKCLTSRSIAAAPARPQGDAGAERGARTISATCSASASSASAARWRRPTSRLIRWIRRSAVVLASRRPGWSLTARSCYIGGVIAGRECGRPAGRADPYRAGVRAGGDASASFRYPAGGRAFGLDRPLEPIPDTAARWRSPFVLRDRSHPRTSAVGTVSGNRLPHRSCDGRHVDDICNFQ